MRRRQSREPLHVLAHRSVVLLGVARRNPAALGKAE